MQKRPDIVVPRQWSEGFYTHGEAILASARKQEMY